jgi:hypothetical protein
MNLQIPLSAERLAAPRRKFRLVFHDKHINVAWTGDDLKTLRSAREAADRQGDHMMAVYVFNDRGRCRYEDIQRLKRNGTRRCWPQPHL